MIASHQRLWPGENMPRLVEDLTRLVILRTALCHMLAYRVVIVKWRQDNAAFRRRRRWSGRRLCSSTRAVRRQWWPSIQFWKIRGIPLLRAADTQPNAGDPTVNPFYRTGYPWPSNPSREAISAPVAVFCSIRW
jgi:hypothetical protein